MFYEEIRRRAEAAPRAALPAVAAALWQAFSDGKVSEAEAEALSRLIEARQTSHAVRATSSSPPSGPQERQSGPRRPGAGSRPRTDASMERRRRWAASGRLPPGLAARFTLAEQAVLSLIAAETARRGDCRLAVGHLAALVGVAETTVRNAVREARRLGLVTVEERRVTGFRNDTNVVRIVSAEWTAWLRLTRKSDPLSVRREGYPSPAEGGGCKSAKGTPTEVLERGKPRPAEPSRICRQAAGDPADKAIPRIRGAGRAGRAMP